MIISNFVFIVGTILIGSFAKLFKIVPENTSDGIHRYVLNIALPAIILLNVPKLESFVQVVTPVTVHWISFLTAIAIFFIIAKLLNFSRESLWTLIIAGTLGNTAFLGIPMVETFYGHDSILTAIFYDQLGSGLGFILLTAIFIPIYQGKGISNIALILKNLFKFPPFLALLLGLLMRGNSYPQPIEFLLGKLAVTLVPMAMFAVGLDFSLRIPRENILPILTGLFVKLLLVPLIILGGIKMSNIEFDRTLSVSLFQSGMPPMVTAGILAISVGLNRQIVVSLVGLGLIFSFATLFFLQYLI